MSKLHAFSILLGKQSLHEDTDCESNGKECQ